MVASRSIVNSKHPLPPGWAISDQLEESVAIGPLELRLVGLIARGSGGAQITGSAAGCDEPPFERAYFELLERIAVFEAARCDGEPLVAYSATREVLGTVARERVFPSSPEPEKWRYSLSNGVALHRSWLEACRAAAFELVERDRLLRSWYGELRPSELGLSRDHRLEALESYYDLGAYAFSAPGDDVQVAGLFGFPRSVGSPMVFGWGAAALTARALEKATEECLQRLGFLWGEAVPDQPPPFAPTAEYHQEVYLQPGMVGALKEWLAGRRAAGPMPARVPRAHSFIDVTPPCLGGELYVAKAIGGSELPLVFGKDLPLFRHFPHSAEIHPIC